MSKHKMNDSSFRVELMDAREIPANREIFYGEEVQTDDEYGLPYRNYVPDYYTDDVNCHSPEYVASTATIYREHFHMPYMWVEAEKCSVHGAIHFTRIHVDNAGIVLPRIEYIWDEGH